MYNRCFEYLTAQYFLSSSIKSNIFVHSFNQTHSAAIIDHYSIDFIDRLLDITLILH